MTGRHARFCQIHALRRDIIITGFVRRTIWKLRVEAVQDFVLVKWKQFTIWNAGKQGRKLYRSLRAEYRAKVEGNTYGIA